METVSLRKKQKNVQKRIRQKLDVKSVRTVSLLEMEIVMKQHH